MPDRPIRFGLITQNTINSFLHRVHCVRQVPKVSWPPLSDLDLAPLTNSLGRISKAAQRLRNQIQERQTDGQKCSRDQCSENHGSPSDWPHARYVPRDEVKPSTIGQLQGALQIAAAVIRLGCGEVEGPSGQRRLPCYDIFADAGQHLITARTFHVRRRRYVNSEVSRGHVCRHLIGRKFVHSLPHDEKFGDAPCMVVLKRLAINKLIEYETAGELGDAKSQKYGGDINPKSVSLKAAYR